MSPLIHNAALRHLGINAMYLPFGSATRELATFVRFPRRPVHGYMTIPQKEAAASWRQEDSTSGMGAPTR